jgi:hypothetical protein
MNISQIALYPKMCMLSLEQNKKRLNRHVGFGKTCNGLFKPGCLALLTYWAKPFLRQTSSKSKMGRGDLT